MYPIKQNGIQETLKMGIRVAVVSVATIGTSASSVLADEGGFQGHMGDSHSGSEHTENCYSLTCCHNCGSDSNDDN
jgi:hypothetical protein